MRSAFRASILHCLTDPGEGAEPTAVEYFADGILLVEDGRVAVVGSADKMIPQLGENTAIEDFSGKLLLPGFIDCHVHYPQLDVIASYGEQLLDWLERYAYPAEMRFKDPAVADEVAAVFLDELLKNGTTTALVFGTVHAHSADAIFKAAEQRGMRLIAGKVMMDRNCPVELRDDAESSYDETKALIERWHGKGRLGYAITPRFAITSSEEQLDAAGRLAKEHPDVWVHTHLAENKHEVAEVARLFPGSASYLDVYDGYDLLRERSVFAHCVHLSDADRAALARKGGAVAFCPTSNLFLGSGLFDFASMQAAGVRCGLATDIGGGTSLSLLRTAGEAYKVLRLQGQSLPATRALFLATLGAAEALHLDDKIGNFQPGKEADFVLIDPAGSSLTARRSNVATNIDEALFALMMLADERNIAATYVGGVRARAAH